MKLSIYSLKNVLFQGEAKLLNCKTVMGEITVLDNHETFIGVINAGIIKVVEKNPSTGSGPREHFFPVKSGFLEVKPGNEVRCIIEE